MEKKPQSSGASQALLWTETPWGGLLKYAKSMSERQKQKSTSHWDPPPGPGLRWATDCTVLTNLPVCNRQCTESESLWSACSALNPTFISKSSSQGPGSYVKALQEPGTVVTPKEERLPGTAKLTPRWAHGDRDSMRRCAQAQAIEKSQDWDEEVSSKTYC